MELYTVSNLTYVMLYPIFWSTETRCKICLGLMTPRTYQTPLHEQLEAGTTPRTVTLNVHRLNHMIETLEINRFPKFNGFR